jgi:EAL domain-containing protein (putative c-di-GMP-specific phosphodiesterase class I)
VKVELTETAIASNPAAAKSTLMNLHDAGIRIAIDDFGTGYSSLSHLSSLPVDELKIDRAFVKDMISNNDNACIVRSTIELGHSLGLKVLAEGVEDRRTWDLLMVVGCDLAQGYYTSPPVSAPRLTSKLRDAT